MKKVLYTFLLSLLAFTAAAQGYKSTRIGLLNDGTDYYLSYPSTTIVVELMVQEEVVTPGIYARYAQKYLTQRATLIAQTTYSIVGASIDVAHDGDIASPLIPTSSSVEYSKLPVDQYSSTVLPAEDAARDAATAIFTIRRQRRDIINGEAGEGYFGAGLKDAMDRLDALEAEYLELFMGSRTISQSVKRYIFNPQEGSNRYVIARFDPRGGLLSANDLSGTPVYIQFTPQPIPDTSSLAPQAKSRESIWFRFAAPTDCTLYNDSEAVVSTLLPIYEFGTSVQIETIGPK